MLRKNEIKRFVEQTASSAISIIEEGDQLFYRKHLKKQVESCEISKPSEVYFDTIVTLNKRMG